MKRLLDGYKARVKVVEAQIKGQVTETVHKTNLAELAKAQSGIVLLQDQVRTLDARLTEAGAFIVQLQAELTTAQARSTAFSEAANEARKALAAVDTTDKKTLRKRLQTKTETVAAKDKDIQRLIGDLNRAKAEIVRQDLFICKLQGWEPKKVEPPPAAEVHVNLESHPEPVHASEP